MINEIRRELRLIIVGLEAAMGDEFDKWYDSDLQNAINDLNKLQRKAEGNK